MTHKVEVRYGDGTPVEGQGYTTSKKETSGQVQLHINDRRVVIDTFDLFNGTENVATCITFPDTVDYPPEQRVEHFDHGDVSMIQISNKGTIVHLTIPDGPTPALRPIGIHITRL
jgi:hypothetical protein